MKFKSATLMSLPLAVVAAFATIPTFAAPPALLAIANTAYNDYTPNVTFTNGTLTIGGTKHSHITGKIGQGYDPDVIVSFVPLNAVNSTAAGPGQTAMLNYGAGSFTVKDAATSTLLLGGSFTNSDLLVTLGSTSGHFDASNVSYDPRSTYINFPSAAMSPYTLTGGTLHVEFGADSPIGATAGAINNFSANDGITYFAPFDGNTIPGVTPAPEPGSYAILGIGVLGVAGLALRRKSRRLFSA